MDSRNNENRIQDNRIKAIEYILRGNAYFNEDEFDKSIAHYKKAIELDPAFLEAYGNCAIAYKAKGDMDNAIVFRTKLIAVIPEENKDELAKAYFNRGNAYCANHDYDHGIADYKQAIKFDPGSIAYHNLNHAYFCKSDWNNVIASCKQLLAMTPDEDASTLADIYTNRGLAYFEVKEFDKCITDCKQAIELNLNHINAYIHCHSAYQAKSEWDNDIALLTQLITRAPNDLNAYYQRANAYYLKDEWDKALDDLNHIVKFFEDQPKLIDYDFLKEVMNDIHDMSYDTKELDGLNEKDITAAVSAAQKKYETIPKTTLEKAFLWRATKNNHAPIYIFGTHHFLSGVDVIDIFDESIKNMVSKADIVFTETTKNTSPENIVFNTQLSHPSSDDIFSLDNMFAIEAKRQNKTLKPLENEKIREMCGVKYNFSLNDWLKEDKNNLNFFKTRTKEYLAQVINFAPAVYASKRSYFWMAQHILPTSAAGQTSLVVAGRIHEWDMIPCLIAEGYTVEPLMKQAPTPKSEIVRRIFNGSQNTFFKPENSMPSEAQECEIQYKLPRKI